MLLAMGLSMNPTGGAMNKITVSKNIIIRANPEKVWDDTQDWSRRAIWDPSVLSACVKSENPRCIQVNGRGGLKFEVQYKLADRPKMTTVAMLNMNSAWIKGGGGSWKYEAVTDGTLWTQHNTLVLRDDFWGKCFKPIFRFILERTTDRSMKVAKSLLEKDN
jgi:hypothetical protein